MFIKPSYVSWLATSSKLTVKHYHTFTLLSNGKVTVIGMATSQDGYRPVILIIPKGSATSGARYKYRDRSVTPGKTYFYKLEDVDSSTGSNYHGPISVKVKFRKKN